MTFYDLVQDALSRETLGMSLWAFRPELAICATIVAMLLVRMFAGARTNAYYVLVLGTAAALYFSLATDTPSRPIEIFSRMLVFDAFSIYMRRLLLVFTLLFAAFTQTAGVPDRENSTEFYVLILGAVLGMCLMVAANHMVIVFLGIEMASVPSYALAGFLKHRRLSTEAALKFAVFGGGTAGVMLYGISLLVGSLGSAHLPTMAGQLVLRLQPDAGPAQFLPLALGALMVMVGVAFKLSAVPFHFWIPDVFEGASAEVAAFLSIASKAAALALLVRLALGFSYVEPSRGVPEGLSGPAPAAARPGFGIYDDLKDSAPSLVRVSQPTVSSITVADRPGPLDPRALAALAPARRYLAGLIALLAAVTCTFGNLAAYGQTNMKRLLAYSTIAHAGYMMMAVAAAVALVDKDPAAARGAVAALGFYLGIYLFMNLGAFAGVAFLRNALASEEIDHYAGLVRRSPGVVVCLAIILFSLVGLPPLAGFAAKFTIFASVYDAGLLGLLAIGVLNTALSLFYYVRVVKTMILDPEPLHRPTAAIPLWSNPGLFTLVLVVPLVVFGIWWKLFDVAQAAAASLL